MKLYVDRCDYCDTKIPLRIVVANRSVLRLRYGQSIRIQCPTCGNIHSYLPHRVKAESDSSSAIGGGVVGGLVGLLGGPLGLILGGVIGGAIGNESDSSDRAKVNRFNSSH